MSTNNVQPQLTNSSFIWVGWEPITNRKHIGYLFVEVTRAELMKGTISTDKEISLSDDTKYYIREYDYSQPEFTAKGELYYPHFRDYCVNKVEQLNALDEVAVTCWGDNDDNRKTECSY